MPVAGLAVVVAGADVVVGAAVGAGALSAGFAVVVVGFLYFVCAFTPMPNNAIPKTTPVNTIFFIPTFIEV